MLIPMVSLLRDGAPEAMLDELIAEVGRDATRFSYLLRRHDTPLDFDLEVAKRQSMDNPVYCVQYGHARCAAIRRRAAAQVTRNALRLFGVTAPEQMTRTEENITKEDD